MSNVLDALLQMEPPKPQEKEYRIKRLSEAAGQDVVFRLKELSYTRVEELKKLVEDHSLHIVLAGTAEPDLKNPELLKKYNAPTPAELVRRMLLPGEIEDLSCAIEQLVGYRVRTIQDYDAFKKNLEKTRRQESQPGC